MKGVRFYEECDGNVVAIFYENYTFEHNEAVFDAIGAVFFYYNAPVSSTRAPQSYLRKQCKRISESRAREVHPRLFAYLDETE